MSVLGLGSWLATNAYPYALCRLTYETRSLLMFLKWLRRAFVLRWKAKMNASREIENMCVKRPSYVVYQMAALLSLYSIWNASRRTDKNPNARPQSLASAGPSLSTDGRDQMYLVYSQALGMSRLGSDMIILLPARAFIHCRGEFIWC